MKDTKWYVSGYTIGDRPSGPIFGNCDWFCTNVKFNSKKEAMVHIRERQRAYNRHGKIAYFSLSSKTYENFFDSRPMYSKLKKV